MWNIGAHVASRSRLFVRNLAPVFHAGLSFGNTPVAIQDSV